MSEFDFLGDNTNGDETTDFDSVFGDGNLFDGTDIKELPDDPFALPKDVYKWRVNDANLAPTKNDTNKYGILVKMNVCEGPFMNRFYQEWFQYPTPDMDKAERVKLMAIINNFLDALGLTEAEKTEFNHRNYRRMLDGREFMGEAESVPDRKEPSRKVVKMHKKMPLTGNPLTGGAEGIFG